MNFKKLKNIIIYFFLVSFPLTIFSARLVPDCGENQMCNFENLMQLANNVINFVLFVLATPLFALIVMYAGWLYLSSSGNTENVSRAKTILTNAIFGYLIALAAWIIVKTILVSLGFEGPLFLNY